MVKMRKEEAKEYDSDPNISAIFASDTEDSSDATITQTISMNLNMTKMDMWYFHSRTSLEISIQIDWLVVLASCTG